MKVTLSGGGEASQSAVSTLELAIGKPLDAQFRRFVTYQNGATPGSNSFPVNGVAHMGGVNQFIAVEDIVPERSYIDDLPPHAYPVALSSGGNYVLLDQSQGGAIFFWDHEIKGGIYKIANSFEIFLDMLEPFDVSKIKPAPGQVKSAWIDPDFFKKLDD